MSGARRLFLVFPFLSVSVLAAGLKAQDAGFVRGDVNQDRIVDISDAVAVLFHLFQPGYTAPCEKAADADDNGAVEITDAVRILNFLFLAGPWPAAPFPNCAPDPTPDALGCENPACTGAVAPVVISEILASNDEGLRDEDGDSSDWIELHMVEDAVEEEIDLGGWYLTQDPNLLDMWRFPAGVILRRGDFLVVFASGKDRKNPNSELHTDFRLDDKGEYLALVAPDGVTIVDEIAPAYPPQLTDVSYGLAQATTALVSVGDVVRYRVPAGGDAGLGTAWTEPGFDDGGWSPGRTGLGFSGVATEGFEVTFIKSRVAVTSLSVAQNVAQTPSQQAQVVTETAPFIDFYNTGGRGNFSNDNPFPGIGFGDVDDFVVIARGTVLIPSTGSWTFGVNSDDGFGFTMTDGQRTYSMSFPQPRGPGDTLQTFNIARAGPHDIELIFYERGGGAELELFAARGAHSQFNSRDFRLVGDVANGGLPLAGFAGDIETDLEQAMRGANASLWVRARFTVDDPSAFGGLLLRVKYEDGFIAYLNGQEVARRNAPASPQWNSRAAADRPLEDVGTFEEINLTGFLGFLAPGTNVLAIHALNDAVSDPDFLFLPELIAAGRVSERRYMETPTPGAFNAPGAVDFVRDVVFSVERGFYEASFDLELSTPTPGASIRYTRDGSTPTPSRGTLYTGPIRISGTSTIRAMAYKADHLDSKVVTHTYIFVSDVIRQSPNGQPPGPGWPSGSVNGQVLDYGMDPNVTQDPRWAPQMEEALLSIPSISLVTDLENLFSSSTGIYVNARNDGRAWERPTSVELIYPDGRPGFGVNAGLRIRGAFSRSGDNPKHSLRLFFRREYGPGKLRYALFGGEGADEFDAVDLRTSQNYSWAFQGSDKNTFLREVFSRDAQRDTHQPYTRSRYYHLYINGHYWGLYQTQERVNAAYAESYFGGREEDYDVIKNDSSGSRALMAADGTMEAYRRLYDAAVAGFSSDAAYLRVLGLRSDGTPDPQGEQLVDPENLMDYMICTYYTGDPDAPVSAWAHFSNNVFAVYNRVRKDGFKWFRHDAEHSLGANGGLFEGRLLTDPVDRTIGQEWRHFNPAWLHLRLTQNAEYRMAFADRVVKHFFHGGAFTPEANLARWNERAAQIELAVIGASARWGDAKREPPRTKDDWLREVNWMRNVYFPQRTDIVLGQMRSVNMFPEAAILSFNRHGGEVEPGFQVVMTQSNGEPGTIYYTTNGEDPRLWGGGINPNARIYEDDTSSETLIARGSVWRYLDTGTDPGAGWNDLGFDDSSWGSGPAQLGYGDGDEATVIDFGPDPSNKYPAYYFRRVFNVTDAGEIVNLTLRIVRDDGAAVYLNGVEAIPRINLPAGPLTPETFAEGPGVPVGGAEESTFFEFSVDPALLREGANVVAVEVHQANASSSDLSFDLELVALRAGGSAQAIIINETTTVKARVRTASEWGAMTSARFWVGVEGLVINEVVASNQTGIEDPAEPGERPDWIEIYNGTGAMIDLGGMYLTDDPTDLRKWRIADGIQLAADEFLVFFADDDGTQGPLHTNFQLSRAGEWLVLVDRDGETIIDEILFDEQEPDVSYGRYPDGTGDWAFLEAPTPFQPNRPPRP